MTLAETPTSIFWWQKYVTTNIACVGANIMHVAANILLSLRKHGTLLTVFPIRTQEGKNVTSFLVNIVPNFPYPKIPFS